MPNLDNQLLKNAYNYAILSIAGLNSDPSSWLFSNICISISFRCHIPWKGYNRPVIIKLILNFYSIIKIRRYKLINLI